VKKAIGAYIKGRREYNNIFVWKNSSLISKLNNYWSDYIYLTDKLYIIKVSFSLLLDGQNKNVIIFLTFELMGNDQNMR